MLHAVHTVAREEHRVGSAGTRWERGEVVDAGVVVKVLHAVHTVAREGHRAECAGTR